MSIVNRKTLIALLSATALSTALISSPTSATAASRDLAGLWPLNEGSGQVARDWSFSGNAGQLGSTDAADDNDPTWITLPRIGFLPRAALRFDGADFVRVPNAPSLEPDGVTVVARVRSTTVGAFRYVVSKGALSCDTASYGLYTGSDGGLMFYVSDGTAFTLSADAGQAIWNGAWHTVIGAFDGTSVRLFVDGVEVGSPVPAAVKIGYALPDSRDFFLGDYAGPCGSPLGFVGDIDGAALIGSYDTATGGLVH